MKEDDKEEEEEKEDNEKEEYEKDGMLRSQLSLLSHQERSHR